MLYRFYLNIGIPIYQGYGQTEASPVICTNSPQHNKIGTCGKAFFGVEVKLSDEGELLAKGANIMRGYHNNMEATKEVIDAEGWLHTGDLGDIDAEGYISITGRKKEQFKTSTGEYVSAVYIEQELKSNGWFEYVLVVGEDKPFVVALLFIEPEFLGQLAKEMKSTPLKALESERLERMVAGYIDRVNVKLNHWEKIRRFKVVANTPTIENGQITPSMKLVKRQLLQDYHAEITLMYKDHI
jgi:long-chain acyl-CoA synthetase